MKTTFIAAVLMLLATVVYSQKPNLDKLPEKERNEYLLKTAYEAVMKHAPEWYRDYKEPEIKSFTPRTGDDKSKLIYTVRYFHDPSKEYMEYGYAVAVSVFAETGRLNGISFGDGEFYTFPPVSTRDATEPFCRPYSDKVR